MKIKYCYMHFSCHQMTTTLAYVVILDTDSQNSQYGIHQYHALCWLLGICCIYHTLSPLSGYFASSKGLKINNKDMIYWEDGMFLRHEMGHFMLESVQSREREGCVLHGILITVQSLEEDYSIMGMIVDAVEDLLSDHYPGKTTLTQESHTRSYLPRDHRLFQRGSQTYPDITNK